MIRHMRLIRTVGLIFALAGCAGAGTPLFHQSAFAAKEGTQPDGWSTWTPRLEIAPQTYVDLTASRDGRGSLAIRGNGNPAAFGGWQHTVAGILPGRWYHLEACYRAEGLSSALRQLVPRLDWLTTEGQRAGQPDFAWRVASTHGEWNTVMLDAEAPAGATAVKIQLLLLNAPQATVWWDEVSLALVDAPEPRRVSVAALNLFPRQVTDPVGQFLSALDKSLPPNTDIVVLGEGITAVGTRMSDAEAAEPIPGPTTNRLGEFARRRHTWLVAGMYEREGRAVYNTAVLIDRAGRVAGRYRKVYLPREDLEAGLTPGNDYPVFRTDFGTVGLMVCWDSQYADPARALALRGAELVLLPIWGGNQTLVKARAIENRVFVAASGYGYPTQIIDPNGEVLSQANERGSVAATVIDLNKRYVDPWLGNMRDRFVKELRLDVLPQNR